MLQREYESFFMDGAWRPAAERAELCERRAAAIHERADADLARSYRFAVRQTELVAS